MVKLNKFKLEVTHSFSRYKSKNKKKSGEKSIPREQPNQNKDMKIADPVLLSLSMRDNEKCNISHAL